MRVTFTYIGKVRGQGRPRFGRGHTYEKKEDTAYKSALRRAYMEQCAAHFHDNPISVTVDVMRALPKSKQGRSMLARLLAAFGICGEPDTYKPDADNLAKAVLDALNCVAYADDSQVVILTVRKYPRVKRNHDVIRVTIADVGELLYNYE